MEDEKKPEARLTTHEAIRRRREEAVAYKIAGLSLNTILSELNKRAEMEGWGVITRRTLELDIAEYFRENRAASLENQDHTDRMREAHVAMIEKIIEKLSLFIANKHDWKPFEQADATEKLFKMMDRLAEIQNWNLGRPSLMVNIAQTNIHQTFDAASLHNSRMSSKTKDGLKSILSRMKEELKGNRPEPRLTQSDANAVKQTYAEFVEKVEEKSDVHDAVPLAVIEATASVVPQQEPEPDIEELVDMRKEL